jgi:hypothetical protein
MTVSLNYWVMNPVARVSINIYIYIYVYRNLRTQQMSVLVLLCTSYTTLIDSVFVYIVRMSVNCEGRVRETYPDTSNAVTRKN